MSKLRQYKLIVKCVEPWKNTKIDWTKMEEVYKKSFMLTKFTIRDGKVIPDEDKQHRAKNKNFRRKKNFWYKERKEFTILLLQKVLEYARQNKIEVPDCIFYINLGDDYQWRYPELPIFVWAKPEDANGIIFPDISFISQAEYNDGKLIRVPKSWEDQKKDFSEKCKDIKPKDKIDKIFFSGTPSSETRKKLQNYSFKFPAAINIQPEETLDFVPPTEYCKYKYLLDLPGAQPWSFRTRQLFLADSLVLYISGRAHGAKFKEGRRITFLLSLFSSPEDYIDLPLILRARGMPNSADLTKILGNIKTVFNYMNKNPQFYEKIVGNASKIIHNLSSDDIFNYAINTIKAYVLICKPPTS